MTRENPLRVTEGHAPDALDAVITECRPIMPCK